MIEQIKINNYKSIKNNTITLQNINILIGANGVGKSNLISFFELIKQLINQRLGSYILGNGGVNRFFYQGVKHSEQLSGLIDFDNTNAFFFNLKPSNSSNKAFIDYTGDYYNYRNEPSKNYISLWSKRLWDSAVEESDILTTKESRTHYLTKFVGQLVIYHFHDTSSSSALRSECNINDNAALRHDAANLAAFLYRLQETAPQSLRLIEGVVRSIAPYFKGFRLQPSRLTPDNIRLEWEEIGSDMYLDGHSFSDGTLRFIALATVLLQPTPPSTIIIDEPELGLHPQAINKLGALIRKVAVNTQVIIATQSVNLVNCFEPKDIIVVDKTNGESAFRRLSSDDLSCWLSDYSMGEIWEKNIIGGQP